ncbi:MAG: hypothetical protein P4L92_06655 [Rudaea sp.]|nr:hypothetical protein [Rudaea sp.]
MKYNESVVGKVAVLQSGVVSYNGEAVNLHQLSSKLAALKAQNGVVWYYREAPEGSPPPISTQVIQLVIDNKIPISLSSEPDFSTVVQSDGTVKSRQVAH